MATVDLTGAPHLAPGLTPRQLASLTRPQLRARRKRGLETAREQRRMIHAAKVAGRNTLRR